MADALVVTFTCRSCGTPFKHESRDFTLRVTEINCPVCLWSPQETLKK